MEFLVALIPIALILGVCGGMHFFMMRGMHGGAENGSKHDMHGNQEMTGTGETERLRQLESEVASLRDQVAVSRKGTNGTDPTLIASERK